MLLRVPDEMSIVEAINKAGFSKVGALEAQVERLIDAIHDEFCPPNKGDHNVTCFADHPVPNMTEQEACKHCWLIYSGGVWHD